MNPGYKTTEFWITLATTIAITLNSSGLLGSFVLPVETITTIAAVAASYIASRAIAKLKK